MECLVQLASVRRSLFVGEDDRSAYLTQLLHGIRDILKNNVGMGFAWFVCLVLTANVGLNENSNHHGFCRLLARLKSNYQLNQLLAVDCYVEWIKLVADFTIKSIQSWEVQWYHPLFSFIHHNYYCSGHLTVYITCLACGRNLYLQWHTWRGTLLLF